MNFNEKKKKLLNKPLLFNVGTWLTSVCKLIELVNDIFVFEFIDDDDFDGLTVSSRCWYLFDVDDVAEIEEEDETPSK